MRKGKTPSEIFMMIITLMSSLHFFAEANMVTAAAGDRMLIYSDIIRMFTDPIIFPLVCIYFRTLTKKNPFKDWMYISVVPSVILFTGATVLYFVAGIQNSAEYLRHLEYGAYNETFNHPLYKTITLFTKYGYRTAIGVYVFIAIMYIFHLNHYVRGSSRSIIKHYFKGDKLNVVRVQTLHCTIIFLIVLIRIFFSRTYLVKHHLLTDLFALLMTAELIQLFAVGLLRSKNKITAREIFSAFMRPNKKNTITPETVRKKITPDLVKDDRISDAFFKYMEEQEGFRIKGITIAKVAEDLKTNRTYISQILNKNFETSFPDYLNNLRIRYAKDYIAAHPDERQDTIASLCGFDSVSSFSRKFRALEGMTPGMWAEQNKKNS
ncbi:MAG: AraC family transcriptional regulator [Bacteroidales bacterium]|nr:AraC family transcriptional regulator [Bacteroidales bacterium]